MASSSRLATHRRHDPTDDGLALTVGIACVDKHVDVAAAHQSRDDLVLAVRALVPADLPLPVGCRVDGQRVEAPLSPVVVLIFVGRGQVDEVALRPGDQVVADLHIAVMLFHVPADRLGDGLADRMLLGDDQSHPASRPIISSCRTPMRAVRRPRCRVRLRAPAGRARRPPPGRRIRSSPDPSRRRPPARRWVRRRRFFFRPNATFFSVPVIASLSAIIVRLMPGNASSNCLAASRSACALLRKLSRRLSNFFAAVSLRLNDSRSSRRKSST